MNDTLRIKKAKDGSYIVEHSYDKRVIRKGEKIPYTKYFNDNYTAKNAKELMRLVKTLVSQMNAEEGYEEAFEKAVAEG